MKTFFCWLISWALFWSGDAVSRVMNLAEPFGHLYPIYNRLMLWSDRIQGEGPGPWTTVS
jgi:hypothetical protein